MVLSKNLIIGDSIKERLADIMDKIEKEKKTRSFYCVTMASNPKNLLDIYCYATLFGTYYKNFNPKVVALAGSKEEAVSLVVEMTKEVNARMTNLEPKDFARQFRKYLEEF